MSVRKTIIFAFLFSAVSVTVASQGSSVFRKAKDFYVKGEYDSTITVIRSHLSEHGKDPEAQTLVPLIVEAYVRTGQYKVIGNLVKMYEKRFPKSDFLPRLNYLYGVALAETREHQKAIEKFSEAMKGGVNQELNSLIITALSQMCSSDISLEKLEKLASNRRLYSGILEVVRFYTVKKQHQTGATSRAASNASEFLKLYPNSVYAPEIRLIAGGRSDASAKVIEIGVMAPLSGDYRDVGKQIVQGMQVAFNKHNKGSFPKIELVVYDTKSNVVEAVHRAKEIVQSKRVNLVIGPVLSENAAISAVVFEDKEIVMVSPTASDEGIAALGDNIFQMNITLGTLGQRIARYAVENLNIREFAVISPDSYYGRITTEHFLNELKKFSGVQVVHTEYFEEGIHDFSEHIIDLRKELVKRRLGSIASNDASPRAVSMRGKLDSLMLADSTLSIGGIFMPVVAEDVVMLAPQLVFHRIRTQMLGTDGWYNDKVLEDGKKYVQNAIISTPFELNKEKKQWLEFANAYRRRNNEEPDRISALGYDAAQLVIGALREAGTDFNALKKALSNVKGFQGFCGTVTFDKESGANTEAPVMKIIEDGFIRVH